MPQTRDCDFCGSEIPPGTGTMFVRTDGTAIHYCSSKCEKNADLGREPRDVEWIQDEEAEQLRRAEEGSDTVDEDVDDEGSTSAEEQAGEAGEEQAGESGDTDASESETTEDDLEDEAAEQPEEESTDADEEGAEPEEDAEA